VITNQMEVCQRIWWQKWRR